MPNLLETIKLAAVEAVKAEDPTGIIFGTVISVSPLSIMVEQKLTLTRDFLILTKNVSDYQVSMTVNHATGEAEGGTGEEAFAVHSHSYKGKKTFMVHNALHKGDTVILLKQQGGQKYIVLDKEAAG